MPPLSPDVLKSPTFDQAKGFESTAQPALQPPVQATPQYRSFLDVKQQRQFAEKRLLEAMQQRQFENTQYQLRLADVKLKPRKIRKRDEKIAAGEKGTLHHPVQGRWELVDKATGDVVDKKKGTVAYLPHMTDRGTYLVNGTNYVVNHQTRLRPGIYTRLQRNGLVESQFNIAPRTGKGFRVRLDPESGRFKVRIQQGESSLYPLLKAVGVEDEQLRKVWGDELFKANFVEDRNNADLKKTLKRLGVDVSELKPSELEDAAKERINGMGLDPEVMEFITGQPIDKLNSELLLGTTSRMLGVARGEVESDDRDSMAFQTVHGPEDFFAERIEKDAGKVGRKMLWKATKDGNLRRAPSSAYRDAIYSIFHGTGLAQAVEDTNPIEVADLRLKLSRMGEGALRSTEAAPRDARGVQPSHYGLVDGLRTPECHDDLTEVMTDQGWVSWKAVTSETRFACLIDGWLQYRRAEKLVAEPYQGVMYGAKTASLDYLVTPDHRMWVRTRTRSGKPGMYRIESAEQVHQAKRTHRSAGHSPLVGGGVVNFTLPKVDLKSNAAKQITEPLDIYDWCSFLGWYLSEGNVNGSCTHISQLKSANPVNCAAVAELLDRLPFTWHYSETNRSFTLSVEQLASHLRQFGKCYEKFIPDYVFKAPVGARQAFIDAYLAGDGRSDRHGRKYAMCTTSQRMAYDFHRLLFELGVSSRVVFEPDDREERYHGCWTVQIHSRTEREVAKKNHRHPQGQYYTEQYDGMVYCATVPGGLLYTRRNNSCGFWSGNSDKIGLDMRAAWNTFKGEDNKLYTAVINKAGKTDIVSAPRLLKGAIGFAGEMDRKDPRGRVRAMVGGKIKEIPRSQVDFWIKNPEEAYAPTTNMVPFFSSSKAQRTLMGARMTTQAMPLVEREAPLVQSAIPGDERSFDGLLGEQAGATRAEIDGVVTKVTDDEVHIKQPNGETEVVDLYNELPMNRLTNLNQTMKVEPGQRVKKGDLLATSNFTDDDGVTAMGRNLRVGYLSHSGLTFEDANVISESAASKMAAEASLKFDREVGENTHATDVKTYRGLFPDKFNQKQLKMLDNDGVVRKGQVVHPGDPLTLQVDKVRKQNVGSIMRGQKTRFRDESETWEHNYPGQVVDVFKHKDGGAKVVVRSILPAKEGDKLSGRYGDKGVISKVLPDEQMPRAADGTPLDILVSPAGVPSRTNPSQIAEALYGKLASAEGRAALKRAFRQPGEDSIVEEALKAVEKAGLKAEEDVTDPVDDRRIKDVMVGNRYYMRLHHLAEKKLSSRDTDEYTSDDTPAKGGSTGAKRISLAETAALLSAGATEVLRDAKLVRGQRNDDYWRGIQLGYTPSMPTDSVASKKFLEQLKSAGVNVTGRGDNLYLMPISNKDIKTLTQGRKVTRSGTFDWNTMKPVKGGLFDVGATGGNDGTLWSAYDLPRPVLNPIMQEPVQKLLGLSEKELRGVLAGRKSFGGSTGPKAIQAALKKVGTKLDDEIASTKVLITQGAKSKRDAAVKKLRYLESFKKMGFDPSDAIITSVPVLPPKYRPVSSLDSMTLVADPNYLYADMIGAADNLKETKDVFGEEGSGDAYLDLYDSVKAVTGLGQPVSTDLRDKKVKGILAQAVGIGRSPKNATFQRRIIGTAVDQVGRAVIAPDPKLSIDQIGVPKEMAWTQYRKYIVRKLVQRGMPATQAVRSVLERTKPAEKALHEIMEERPVFINRAPTLHRHSIIGGKPVLVDGDAIKLSPAVEGGLGADHDGDAVQLHVPSTDEAVRDVYDKLMPSQNLRTPSSFDVHMMPENEFISGIYAASQRKKEKRPRVFESQEAAVRAYLRGEIGVSDPVTIADA